MFFKLLSCLFPFQRINIHLCECLTCAGRRGTGRVRLHRTLLLLCSPSLWGSPPKSRQHWYLLHEHFSAGSSCSCNQRKEDAPWAASWAGQVLRNRLFDFWLYDALILLWSFLPLVVSPTHSVYLHGEKVSRAKKFQILSASSLKFSKLFYLSGRNMSTSAGKLPGRVQVFNRGVSTCQPRRKLENSLLSKPYTFLNTHCASAHACNYMPQNNILV